jgi:glutathione synthase/RimK-type ligase-like ATP-grasp enzyme
VSASVAIVTCSIKDLDPDQPLLLDALSRVGVHSAAVAWDDAEVNWSSFDLVVLRSPWDYAPRRDEFLTWARGVDNLVNPFEVIERNTDKHYLTELARGGVAVIETQFVDVGQAPTWPTGDFVVKPAVGAGSFDAERYSGSTHDEAFAHVQRLHAAGRDVMVQPYVASIDEHGETAVIFIDGQFAHAMNKGAMLNVTENDRSALFRREQMRPIEIDEAVLGAASTALRALEAHELLYARVDLVQIDDVWTVMEVELTEPSLFLEFRPKFADVLATAIYQRIA